jgi:ribonuclease BN (tRNA processing enzyme)
VRKVTHAQHAYFLLDIKDDNILISVENPAVLDDFARQQKQSTQRSHLTPDGRAIYVSHSHLGPFRSLKFSSHLSDFNDAYRFTPGQAHLNPLCNRTRIARQKSCWEQDGPLPLICGTLVW